VTAGSATRSPVKAPPAPARKRSRRAVPAATLELDAEHVAAVRAVSLAASNDSFRGVLQALHVVADGSTVTWEGCDGYRLHRAVVQCECAPLDAMVPAAWFVKALREVKWGVAGRLRKSTFTVADGRIHVANDVESRSAALMTAPPPKDDHPVGPAPRCGCGYPDTSKNFDKADEGEHLDEQVVGVNPKFFAQVFKAIELFEPTTAARFKVVGGVTPMRFEAHRNGDRFVGLLMPLRISDGGGDR
jgi:hypothetical protein